MVEILQRIGSGIAVGILATSAAIGGLVSVIQTTVMPQEKAAIVYESTPAPPTAIFMAIPTVAETTSTAIVTSTPSTSVEIAALPQAAAATPKIKIAPIPSPVPVPQTTVLPPRIPAPMPAPVQATAQWLVDNAQFSLKPKVTGGVKIAFTANTGAENLSWGAGDAYVGGDAATPKFSFSFTCNPALETPSTGAFDQAPYLAVRTSYDCTMGFAATNGSDRRIATKDLKIATGAGQVIVSPPSAMNTVLADDVNDGGFVFQNLDSKPVTMTDLTLNISYTGLDVQNGPLVLEIIDPSSGSPLYEDHLEKIPVDSSVAYTHSVIGTSTPITFTLNPGDQKLLPFKLLGVHRVMMTGTSPAISIELTGATMTPGDVSPAFTSKGIRWSCDVPIGGYDPNATSGPFASGTACK